MIRKIIERIRYIYYSVYSRRMSKGFGSFGDGSFIVKPCFLQGENLSNISVGNNTRIQGHSYLEVWPGLNNKSFASCIRIGNNCKIGEYNHITSVGRIEIGDGFLSGRFVLITDNSHGGLSQEEAMVPPANRELIYKGEIIIGQNVWVGDKVTIVGNVHIGNNVVIGANSVVTRDIPSNSLAAGVPARVIRTI